MRLCLPTPSSDRRFPIALALKDATLAGLVAFGLFFFMIGLRTEQGSKARSRSPRVSDLRHPGGRWCSLGAFLRTLLFGRGPIPLGGAFRPRSRASQQREPLCRAGAVDLRAAGAGHLFYQNRYLLDLGILVLTYVMLGWGLNIVVGLAGLLDLGYVAFYAVGAYSYALLATQLRPVVLDLPAARRHPRRVLGHHARLSGAAAARRLSRHRHARLRRDHPARAAQLVRTSPAGRTASPAFPRPSFFGLPFADAEGTASPRPSAWNIRRPIASCSCST